MVNREQREKIEKASADLVEVRLAWRSIREQRYHVCTNCSHFWRIELNRMVVSDEADFLDQGLVMCHYCAGREQSRCCTYVILEVTK